MADGNVVDVDFSDVIDKKWTTILTDFQFFALQESMWNQLQNPYNNTHLRAFQGGNYFWDTV